jgi:ribosomal protein L11 methyltransferase
LNWLEISVQVDDEEMAEVVGQLFDDWGHGGAVHEQLLAHQGVTDDHGPITRIKAYLPLTDDGQERQLQLKKGLLKLAERYPLAPPEYRQLEKQDWASAWKSYFGPQRIGQRLLLKLPEQTVPIVNDDIVIELDPGMAFGTGLHATTRMCLVCLEDLVEEGDAVLDVGTGSGILAIAAAMLGARRVLALDSDPTAVQVARNNISMNGLAGVAEAREGSLDTLAGMPQSRWDGITINILAEVIVDMVGRGLVAELRPGGWLVAGGIIKSAEPTVHSTLHQCGMEIEARHQEDDWVTFCATKRQAATGSPSSGRHS